MNHLTKSHFSTLLKKNDREKKQLTHILFEQYFTLLQQIYFSAHFCTWCDSTSHQPLTPPNLYSPLAVEQFSESVSCEATNAQKLPCCCFSAVKVLRHCKDQGNYNYNPHGDVPNYCLRRLLRVVLDCSTTLIKILQLPHTTTVLLSSI